jgi:hypothetical protein
MSKYYAPYNESSVTVTIGNTDRILFALAEKSGALWVRLPDALLSLGFKRGAEEQLVKFHPSHLLTFKGCGYLSYTAFEALRELYHGSRT